MRIDKTNSIIFPLSQFVLDYITPGMILARVRNYTFAILHQTKS